MVVARASGMDLASSLKRNTFLTLEVRPGPPMPGGVGCIKAPGAFMHPPRRGAHNWAFPPRKCITLGGVGGWVRRKPPDPPQPKEGGIAQRLNSNLRC